MVMQYHTNNKWGFRKPQVHKTTIIENFEFDRHEINTIIKALSELRNQLITEGRYTDAEDDLLIKNNLSDPIY